MYNLHHKCFRGLFMRLFHFSRGFSCLAGHCASVTRMSLPRKIRSKKTIHGSCTNRLHPRRFHQTICLITSRHSLPKPGTREVWQYYGVDSRGRFVPRVMQSPYGNYYLYNGAPFLFTTTQPHLYMPYVVD